LRVLKNRTQGNRLSPFVQPHLISPAKVFPNSNARGIRSLPEEFPAAVQLWMMS
jgi:hypothetical protein